MTVDKKINKFFFEIQYNKESLLEEKTWEYDFLLSVCKSYGINPIDLARFILDYQESMKNRIRKKRIKRKVLDLLTGVTYLDVRDFANQTGTNINTAYLWVRTKKERFRLLEVA